MPTYEYSCEKCGLFEFVQKITENALTTCPTCSAPVKRLISATAFHLKGTGWYKTDYASTSAGNSPKNSEAPAGEAKSAGEEKSAGEAKSAGETKSAERSNTTTTSAEPASTKSLSTPSSSSSSD